MNCSLIFFYPEIPLINMMTLHIHFPFYSAPILGDKNVQNRMRNLTKSKNEILGTSVTWSLSELESSVNWNMSSHISILLPQHKYSLLSIFTSIWFIYYFTAPMF